jgi:1L-myo-inositol 1-phosphate cytidylyltransferase / CDP-L-myo-inositol myo-inositolphosphotransferase
MSSDGKILVRATQAESAGAGLAMAGLSVGERCLKQLGSLKLDVIVASDGTCALPKAIPAGVQVRSVHAGPELDELRAEVQPTHEVGLDEVRPSRDFSNSLRVTDEDSRKQAEDAVFAQLLRGDLGIVARHLNKPLSFRITRYLLCHLPFTPNQVSVAAALVGLFGAALVASGARWLMVAGFFLAHAQSVLDGCDGELARVRFQQSKIGEWLDTFIDEGLNIVLFAASGIGVWRATGSSLALAVGLAIASIHVFYDVVALTELVRQGQGGELMRIQWWLTGGINMKNRTGQKRGDWVVIVHGFTRRDFFVFAFLIYALAGVPFLSLVHASIIAVGELVLSTSQAIWRLAKRPG